MNFWKRIKKRYQRRKYLYALVQRASPIAAKLKLKLDNAADRQDLEATKRYLRAIRRVAVVQQSAQAEINRSVR